MCVASESQAKLAIDAAVCREISGNTPAAQDTQNILTWPQLLLFLVQNYISCYTVDSITKYFSPMCSANNNSALS